MSSTYHDQDLLWLQAVFVIGSRKKATYWHPVSGFK
tara:strand:+ start:41457 stop:41564 length:108 start_codon:yes stop_codon:yes gene_type:complete